MISWNCELVLVCDHPDCREEGLVPKKYVSPSPGKADEAGKLACKDGWVILPGLIHPGFINTHDRHLCGKHKDQKFSPCQNCRGTGELRYSSRSEGYGNTQAPELITTCESCRGLGWVVRSIIIPPEGKTP